MFQPLRETWLQLAARQAGALAIAGLLAVPLLATQAFHQADAREGAAQPRSQPRSQAGVEGAARVIDGDTIEIGAVKVRLEGIDAPETEQACTKAAPGFFGFGVATWKCGHEATNHVARLVRDRQVRCDSRGTDAYGRMLGVCTVEGLELNADLVRQGLAWAFVKYSQRYVEIEAEARAAKRGIWQAETKPAWVWRAERWQAAEGDKRVEGGSTCVIKGNITRTGQIYHMPWDRWYEKTRIETAKGERWFCTEGEAVAAGWRPAVTR